MSTLQVTTITTVNNTTPLILSTGNTGGGQIVLQSANADIQMLGNFKFSNTTFSGNLNFTGSVGIGTSSPSAALDVDNGFIKTTRYGTTGALVLASAGGTQSSPTASAAGSSLGAMYFRGYDGVSTYRQAFAITAIADDNISPTSAPAALSFRNTPAGSLTVTEAMRITSNGNIGIGTSTPLELASQKGITLDATDASFVNFNVGGTRRMTLFSGGGGSVSGVGTITASDFYIITNGNERFRVDANGNIGIGTASPISKVTVVTTASDGNVLDWGSGQFVVTSTPNANTRSLGLGISVDANGSYLSSLSPTVDWQPLHLKARTHTMYAEGSTESLKISATGLVTKPNQPAFSATKADANAVIASGSPIKFLTVNYDVKSNYSTSTGRFTAPIAGKYLFTFSGITQDITNYFYVAFGVNGTTLSYTQVHRPVTEGAYSFMSTSHILNLNASDYVTVIVAYNGGSPYFEGSRCSFSGSLLG